MAHILDVAEHILEQSGPIPAMKLHTLCYYTQAYSLVWDGKPLFSNDIYAWTDGPVIEDLYELHQDKSIINPGDIYAAWLDAHQLGKACPQGTHLRDCPAHPRDRAILTYSPPTSD